MPRPEGLRQAARGKVARCATEGTAGKRDLPRPTSGVVGANSKPGSLTSGSPVVCYGVGREWLGVLPGVPYLVDKLLDVG